MMRSSLLWGGLLMTCALARTAAAAGPAGGFPVWWDTGFICGVGPNLGDTCQEPQDCCPAPGDCPADFFGDPPKKNPCEPDFVKVKPLNATLTIIVDDIVKDWKNQTTVFNPDGGRKALTVMLEVRSKDGTHVFAETYQDSEGNPFPFILVQNAGGPFGTPVPVGEAGLVDPATLDAAAVCDWLAAYRQPDPAIAQQLVSIAGIAGVARPVIVKAKLMGPTKTLTHTLDEFGSAVRCRVSIHFLNGPILDTAA